VFMEMHDAWISGNDHKLNKEGSDLIQRKYFSAEVKHWKKFPKEFVQPWSLEVLKTK
ncbi:unnamed protein product, partial [Bubo scandiacus]